MPRDDWNPSDAAKAAKRAMEGRSPVSDGEKEAFTTSAEKYSAQQAMNMIAQAECREIGGIKVYVFKDDEKKRHEHTTDKLLSIRGRLSELGFTVGRKKDNPLKAVGGELHMDARKLLRAIAKRGVDCTQTASAIGVDLADRFPPAGGRGR